MHCWRHDFGIKTECSALNCGVSVKEILGTPESYTLNAPQKCDAILRLVYTAAEHRNLRSGFFQHAFFFADKLLPANVSSN